MITVDLDPERERQLRELARSRSEDPAQVVRRAIEEYLDLQGWGEDSAEEWAESSIALTPEVLPQESWDEDETSDGPR